LLHDADYFVTGNHRRMFGREVALGDVQIGAADPARAHAHEQFVVSRYRLLEIFEDERIRLDRRGPMEHHGAHVYGGPNSSKRLISPAVIGVILAISFPDIQRIQIF